MNFVYDTPKPSTWAALRYMGSVCRALWADHRASLRAWRRERQVLQATPRTDVLYLLAVAAALVAGALVLALTAFDLWADFSAWLRASGWLAAAAMPGVDIDAVHRRSESAAPGAAAHPAGRGAGWRSNRVLLLHELAARPQGVSNPELQADLGITCSAAGQMLFRSSAQGLAKRRHRDVEGGLTRWFTSDGRATAWFEAQLKGPCTAQPAAAAAPKAQPGPKPKVPGKPITIKKARAEAQAQWAQQEGTTTAATRWVRAAHSTPAAAPVVPGWGKPPPIRPGALDYKQHMRPAQAFTKPAHTLNRAGGGRG